MRARDVKPGYKAQRKRDRERRRHAKNRDLGLGRKAAFKVPTQPDCAQLARLLLSGIPLDQSLAYIDPVYAALDEEPDPIKRDAQKRPIHKRWLNSPLLAAEMTLLNGGEWELLEKDVRIRLAYDKHLAELAFLLYSKSYLMVSGLDEQKMDNARTAIGKYLDRSTADPEAPWMRAIRDMYEGRIDGTPLAQIAEQAKQQHAKKES